MTRKEFIERFWEEMDEMLYRHISPSHTAYCCDTWDRVSIPSKFWFVELFSPKVRPFSWFGTDCPDDSEEAWHYRQTLMLFAYEYALDTKAFEEWP